MDMAKRMYKGSINFSRLFAVCVIGVDQYLQIFSNREFKHLGFMYFTSDDLTYYIVLNIASACKLLFYSFLQSIK